jgi:hypothetical protein
MRHPRFPVPRLLCRCRAILLVCSFVDPHSLDLHLLVHSLCRRDDRDKDLPDRRDRDRDRDRDRRDRDRDGDKRRRDDNYSRKDRMDGGDHNNKDEDDDMDEPLNIDFDEDAEDEEEKIRKQREAILAKHKSKSQQEPAKIPTPVIAEPSKKQESATTNGHNTAKPSDAATNSAPAQDVADIVAKAVAAKQASTTAQNGEPGTFGEDQGEDEGGDDMFSVTTPIRGFAPKEDDRNYNDREERDEAGGDIDRRVGVTNADNWDDAEGYFKTRPGEVILDRYQVKQRLNMHLIFFIDSVPSFSFCRCCRATVAHICCEIYAGC